MRRSRGALYLLAWLAAISVEPAPTVAEQNTPAAGGLAPARPELLPVALPTLDGLEPAVAEQIRAQQQAFQVLVARARPSAKDLADAYGTLGQILHVYEFLEAAEGAYANAARLAPGDARWPHLLGYLYQQTGRLEEAVQRFEAAHRLQPADRAATVRLADVLLQLNRLREAREEFERVTETFPALAQRGLGEVALRQNRFDDAVRHFRAALDRVPKATSIHYSLAMAYRGLGRLDDARSHLQQRGTGSIRVGDPIVDGLLMLVRGERGLVVLGRRAYDAGEYEEAADAFLKAVAAAPSSAAARVNLGLARLQLGRTADAVTDFEAALRLEPANATAHASLGTLLARQHRETEALPHLRAALDQAPEDVDAGRVLSAVLVRLGHNDEAITALTRVRAVEPDDEDAIVSLALLLADGGRFGEAVEVLEEANRRFPERTTTATTLARLLASSPDRSRRDGPRALQLATAVYALEPAPVHAETVALSLAELGRCDEAGEWMRRALTEAERTKDAAEAARLRAEAPKYEGASCRPAGR